MGLEVITLNELNQAWKDRSHAFSHLWNLDLKAKIKPEGRRGICSGEEEHEVEGNKTGCEQPKVLDTRTYKDVIMKPVVLYNEIR